MYNRSSKINIANVCRFHSDCKDCFDIQNKKLSEKNTEIQTLEEKLAVAYEKNQELKAANQLLENKAQFLEKELNSCKKESSTQISKLVKRTSELEDTLKFKESQISSLKNELGAQNQKVVSLGKTLVNQEAELQTVLLENAKLEEQNRNSETISNTIPGLSIQMNTLLDLNSNGWLIKSHNYEQTVEKKMITVAIIGMYDVGKSWFCNEFTHKNLSTSGSNQRTDSLDFHFPTEKGNLIALMDTPGSNEAIRCTQQDLVQKLGVAQAKNESNVETSNETLDSNDKAMLHYKLLKNDARILQDLKEKFIGEVADVLILICNRLSEKEQENIFKVIKHYNRVKKERARAQENTSNKRETLLYIVHNYKMLSEIEQVEKQIKRDLKDSFKVEEVQLFTMKKEEFKDCNQSMYQDQFGISHLILAAKGTKAGKYYNPSTFGFLKGRINHIEHRTAADVKKLFLEFCNRNIPKMLKQESIELQMNSDNSAIVKVDGCPNVVLENLRYDEFGDFSVLASYEPRYSVVRRQKGNNTTEVIVDMELMDSEFKATVKQEDDGFCCLRVNGIKNVSPDLEEKYYLRQERELGNFEAKYRLPKSGKPKVTRDPATGTKNGIVRWIFELKDESEEIEV